MATLILIQHCQSEHHINDMSGGWTDTPLTGLGKKQAEMIGKRLGKQSFINDSILFTSDLLRASQTAKIIGEHLKLPSISNSGLREINTGIAAGKTKKWSNENRNPKFGNKFDLDYREFQDGETWREFYKRVCQCMDSLSKENPKKQLIIVTHGGTLGYILAWWLNFKPEMIVSAYFSSSVGGISTLSQNDFGQHVINTFNDTSHFNL
ncbi:MAG: histidine phosphatase family protein [Carnobacterium sp.]|nr:histidine phosphatase family protein [Carnobacterium sp.]